VKLAANEEAIASGVGFDAAGVCEALVAACRELLAACDLANPGKRTGFYIGSALEHRLGKEAFGWTSRDGDPLIETLEGVRLTKSQLLAAGWKFTRLDWSSNWGPNVNEVERGVQTIMRPDAGSLWRSTGAGGQKVRGPGDFACVFITRGPLADDWTCAPRAMAFWPAGHGVPPLALLQSSRRAPPLALLQSSRRAPPLAPPNGARRPCPFFMAERRQ